MNPTLYEHDYYLWLEQTARMLASARWTEVDLYNLVS